MSAQAPDDWRARLDPALQEALAAGEPGAHLSFILHLHDKAELDAASLPREQTARRETVFHRLQSTAETSQLRLRAELARLQNTGNVAAFQPFWVFNGIAVTGDEHALAALAGLPEVARVMLDAPLQLDWDQPLPIVLDRTPISAGVPADGHDPWGIARVRAEHARLALGVDGSGTVVALMDTGVDWQHPALKDAYRGTLADGEAEHAGNWFDAVEPANSVPIDPYEHGTHVAGTAVGGGGLGVAPGAKWIAVRVFDALGGSTFSILHQGFQWLLAPNGDPALAPDVVNGSWGSPQLEDAFRDDVAALAAAGIVPVFAAGNSGNTPGTLASPAAFPEAIAVGAGDEFGRLTWFSSVGPSLYLPGIKPELIAPGARVFSALPGGRYGYANGTSMSAPHVAGTAALLREVDPGISPRVLAGILTRTARPVEGSEPTLRTGWGELDAYRAVAALAPAGRFTGIVRGAGSGIAGVTITLTTPAGEMLHFHTDSRGLYEIAVRAGVYDLALSAFGYETLALNSREVQTGEQIVDDLSLAPLPTGTIAGHVRRQGNGNGVPDAVVQVVGTPVSAVTRPNGRYEITLPTGEYELLLAQAGFERAGSAVTVEAGGSVELDFHLRRTDRVLLVDSGWWYYGSQADYYREALAGLELAHDEWPVYNPTNGAPTLEDLEPYDAVIWSSSADSPGLINAGFVISDYLGLGGHLLISGRNIGAYDGSLLPEAWWAVAMRAMYVNRLDVVGVAPVSGEPGTPFAGLGMTLNGGNGAANQISVDQVAPMPGSYTQSAFHYEEGRTAGLLRGKCTAADSRLVYLGFGLEGISRAGDRQQVLASSFDFFATGPDQTGVRIAPGAVDDLVVPGRTVTYTLTVINEGETITDTFSLSTLGAPWPTHVTTPTLTLGPCRRGQTQLIVNVPPGLPRDQRESFVLRAHSANEAGLYAESAISLKTPGAILLVDDHRFLTGTVAYAEGLAAMGLPFDEWVTGWTGTGRGSPSLPLLNAYDIILWYTGFDWLEPVTDEEADMLRAYLDGGGRLFLSSQDYLYYHHDDPLSTDYLGVAAHAESVTPTTVFGGDNALASPLGALPLAFGMYENHGDGLRPGPQGETFLWHNGGGAAAVATSGSGRNGALWRSVFWGIPLEKLPEAHRAAAVERVVGWLGDLGDSTFAVSRRVVIPGETHTYTLTLRSNRDGPQSRAAVTNTLPATLELDPASLTGEAVYDPLSRRLTWQGTVRPDEAHEITYRARVTVNAPAGQIVDNQVEIGYARHKLVHSLSAVSWIAAPDLGDTTLLVSAGPLRPGRAVTVSAVLRNDGVTGAVSATLTLPEALTVLTGSIRSSAGDAPILAENRRLQWQGEVASGQTITLTVALRAPWIAPLSQYPLHVPVNVVIADGVTSPLVRSIWWEVAPIVNYLPFFFGEAP